MLPQKRKSHNIYLFSVYFPIKKTHFKTGKNKVKSNDTLMRVIHEELIRGSMTSSRAIFSLCHIESQQPLSELLIHSVLITPLVHWFLCSVHAANTHQTETAINTITSLCS